MGAGAAASERVFEALSTKRKVRSPRSVDGCAVQRGAQRGHRHLADDGGVIGKGSGGLKHGGARSVSRQVTRIVVRQVGNTVTTGQARGPHLLHKWAWMQGGGHDTGDISQS